MSAPLSEASANVPKVGSSSVVKFSGNAADKSRSSSESSKSASKVASFSVASGSAIPAIVLAEELIMRGCKKKPVSGQTMDGFFRTITHLHLCRMRLVGDVSALTLCANLKVLYVYENRLTSLGGLGGLSQLTHLYAQENRIESLDDFECPPALLQLHLTGNRLGVIGGLETCTCLEELHVGSQKVATPPTKTAPDPDEASELEALPTEEEDDDDAKSSAPKPMAPRAAAAGGPAPPLAIEPASLMAIAPSLAKLVVAHSRIDDDALEPLIVLQNLTALDVRANDLESIGRLQQFLLRMPLLRSLSLGDNPLTMAPKMRERLIVASPSLQEVDGKAIKANERQFLMTLAHRQGSAASSKAASSGPASRAASAGPTAEQLTSSRNRGRPQQLGVSIPSAATYNLGPRHALIGEPPAGFYDEEHRPTSLALQSGARRPWARTPNLA